MGGKAGISVGDQAFGESKPGVEVLVVELCDLGSRDTFLAGEEDGRSRAAVVDYC